MLEQLRERRDDDKGFTLIELMVVVLIIAILVAIAVPTFMGARTRAQDRSAQSTARNALTTGRILFTDDGDFGDPANIAANLITVDGGLTFQAAASTDSGEISVVAADSADDPDDQADVVTYAVLSDSGTCFYLQDASGNSDGGAGATLYAQADLNQGDTCDAAGAPAAGDAAWSTGSGW